MHNQFEDALLEPLTEECAPVHFEEEKMENSKEDIIDSEIELREEIYREPAIYEGDTRCEVEEVCLMGDAGTSECNAKENYVEEFSNRECCENDMTVEVSEKLEIGAEVLTNGGTEALFCDPEIDGKVLLVSEFDVEENSMIENVANQAPVVIEDLSVDARTSNENEGNKDDDATIAGEAEEVPKKKVKKFKKIVKKKKIVMQKAVVAVDESKSQFLKEHEPVVEAGTDENGENPDLGPSDEANISRRVRKRRRKKNAQQPSETGGSTHVAKSKPSEKNKSSGKEIVAYGNKNVDREEEKSEGKVKMLKTRKGSQGEAAQGNAGELTAEDKDKAEPSKSPESLKKVKAMGMIFMCSSKTKEDCFRHKIFGLPGSKKDMVLSIYKGMRLFLFDFQSRLLYGIYKAKGPGGYNIEPDVFNSNFPSQVRFTIFKDCLPLPEEKFKEVIKDNYYTKNKFNCQLNPDQVKKLCKLFLTTSKKVTKPVGKTPIVGARAVLEQKKKRRAEDDAPPRVGARPLLERKKKRRAEDDAPPRVGARPVLEQKRKRRAEDDANRYRKNKRAYNDARQEMDRRRANDNGRRPYHTRYSPHTMSSGNPHAVVYEREAYVPPELPTLSYVPLPSPVPTAPAYTSSYNYGRTSGADIYGQESAMGRQDRGLAYSTRLHYLDEGRSDPYPYTSAIGHQDRGLAYSRLQYLDERRSDLYTEPVLYRDPRYYTSARQDSSSSAVSQDEYRPSSSRTSYDRVPLPPYRRY